MFAVPPRIETRLFTRLPERLEKRGVVTEWMTGKSHGIPTAFLEGPSFDRQGNLWCVDIPYGRVFRIDSAGEFTLVAEYDGEPNGLRFHRDGRIFIADQKRGIVNLDPVTGTVTPFDSRAGLEGLKGPNDLTFASNGDLYFTDQGLSGLNDPTGRLIRVRASGEVEILLRNLPGPNGLVFGPDETSLFVAVTRENAIFRVVFNEEGAILRLTRFIQMSGGSGPDGLALDEQGNLAIGHSGLGSAWLFSPRGEPLYRMEACTGGTSTTNLAYGGPDGRTLFLIDSSKNSIVTMDMPFPGKRLFSHS